MTFAVIWIVLGLAVGFGSAVMMVRRLRAKRDRQRAAALPVHTTRQQSRRAMREHQKRSTRR